MVTGPINNIVVLGRWPDRQGPDADLAAAGLGWTAIEDPRGLPGHMASAAPAAAAILPADQSSDERDRWLADLRSAAGLWASTPVIAWPVPTAEGGLREALEQWMGPLADPGFRDPESPIYRLVRLVGLDRAGNLLDNLASTLREVLAQAAMAPIDTATAHRLAGLSGLYGFARLGRCWQDYESGESSDASAALSATTEALARLEVWRHGRNCGQGLVP